MTREVTAAQEAMADKVIEYARGMAVLRTFATPDESLAAAKASFQQKRAADYHQEAAAQGILKLYALVFNLASCAVLFTACALYLNGALPLSWALTLLVAAFMIYGELISANNGAFLTKKIEGELDRVDEVCAVPKQDTMDAPLAPVGFDLAMEDVSFSYDGVRRVIDGVTLSIPEGTTCALVGPSGSGKTTLVNLIPDSGTWTPARCCSGPGRGKGTAESLLAHVSMVFQNVSVQRHRGEQHQVRHAERHPCRRGGRRQARPLPRVHHAAAAGLRHGARGGRRQPSGGERQRISIARAIMKDAPIVILTRPRARSILRTSTS
ncbi:MAG: ATP-binding cassette domain-containing protein [Eggerthella lenta]